jgi:predicted nucleotidyltransferase
MSQLNPEFVSHIANSGFVPVESLVHLFVGGSELHGAKVGAIDDLDIYGVFIDPPASLLGLDPREHFVWSTASDDRRNGPDDVDITLYSLRKWASMAARGNATCLHFLFADATASSVDIWRSVQARSELFLSKRSAEQFLGFAENQRKRITGEKGQGAKGRRPEYECAFGYDTKAAMHCLRLLFECIELMRDGTITLPRPERELLIEVRQGAWTLERFLREANSLEAEARLTAQASMLPQNVDRSKVSRLIAEAHLSFWRSENTHSAVRNSIEIKL